MIRSRLSRLPLRVAALALVAAAGLSGCAEIGRLTSAANPINLYALSPKSTFPATMPSVSSQLVVEEPTADASVNTDRIAVKPNDLELQYFPVARWVDRAPLVVQRLMIESFENTGALTSVGRSSVGLRADYTLLSDLREFQALLSEHVSPDPTARPEDVPVDVLVRLNLKLVKEPEALIVSSRSFSARRKARSNAMIDVARAFDDALGRSMREAVIWTVQEIDRVNKSGRFERRY
ncbi:MAG: ABC-type transport auxiliary lipoprotein family protein [Pseudomonadota bacterium]|nr:ABC-type transport auxiliary lipoprotein family protein [Pseudomonadota bacterium]MEE3101620.1 ABC-type transport auxiliary lipoprotein family protein [Pseudomonadota bacterium]